MPQRNIGAVIDSGSITSSIYSLPTLANQSLNGSAFLLGMDWIRRKTCSVSATSVRYFLPSAESILS